VNPLDPLLRACLTNPALKARLIAEPRKVLAEHGLKVPPGVTITVVENTASVFHLVLPAAATDRGSLSDQELASAAGGMTDWLGETVNYKECGELPHG